jgi:hypothetical protein
MQQANPVIVQQPNIGLGERGFVASLRQLLQSDPDAEKLMYRGHPLIGAILSAHPLRLAATLSLTAIVFLLLPALWAHVALIRDSVPSKWPWVGFWQRWNWSAMYVVVLPLIYTGIAWLSRACPSIFRGLTVPAKEGAKPRVTKLDGSSAYDFLDSIGNDIARSSRAFFYGILLVTAVLTVADVALIAKGYYLHVVRHTDFIFPDSDWSVAFQLPVSRFHFYGWTQRGPWSNLLFDVAAYSAQTLSIFFGLFWIAKYWAVLNSFSKQLIDNKIDFRFNPWWSDPWDRMGLAEVGRLFTGFLFVAVLFQLYVFGHRLQLVARAKIDLLQYAREIKEHPTDLGNLWRHADFWTCTTGMWLLLIFVLLPVVVISWVPLVRFRRYLQGVIEEDHRSLQADLERFAEGSNERKVALREWEEVNRANIWPNGDFTGWVFLTLMVVLTVAAWFPPVVGYLAVGGGGALLVKFLSGLRGKRKAE